MNFENTLSRTAIAVMLLSWHQHQNTKQPKNLNVLPLRYIVSPMSYLIVFPFPDRSFLVANTRDGQCHIIYCSDGFCRLTGYSRAEVMQRPASCEFLCGPLTSQQSVGALRDALNDSQEKHAELLYYKKDGESISKLLLEE